MIFDSDIIVWHLRGNEAATAVIDDAAEAAISIVTYMEIIRGTRNRRETRETKHTLADYGFIILPLTASIGARAAYYMEEHEQRPGLDVPDVLIAATAVEHGLVLCTANVKHYSSIEELELFPFRP